MKSDIESAI